MIPFPSSLRQSVVATLVAASFSLPLPAFADDDASALKVTGFVSLVGGRILSNTLAPDYTGGTSLNGFACPCYVADWTNAGIYGDGWTLKPESRAGIQLKYTFSDTLNAVGQVVVRGTDTKPNVQWAYLSYTPTKNLEFQVGRKRIPLYYYSDFQDVGISYPWVNVPPEMYGWEVTNFNGASARYKTAFGDTNATFSVFGGQESDSDAAYHSVSYPGVTSVKWRHIAGGDVEVSRGPLTARAVYIQSKVKTVNTTYGMDDVADMKAFGVALNLDLDQLFVLSEITRTQRVYNYGLDVTAPAMTIGAGYHLGAWTPFVNYSRYLEHSSDHELYEPTAYRRTSLSLRYDIDRRSALKLQLDRHYDQTRNYGGDSTILRVAYDRLF